MRKLELNLESLTVQSFDTMPLQAAGRGTVLGRGVGGVEPVPATYPNCPSPLCVDTPLASCEGSCAPYSCHDTCKASCNGSCVYSCEASCGGTCGDTCYETCPRTCGPLCMPDPTDPVIGVRY